MTYCHCNHHYAAGQFAKARRKKGALGQWEICAECEKEGCEHAFVHPDVVIPWIYGWWTGTGEVDIDYTNSIWATN